MKNGEDRLSDRLDVIALKKNYELVPACWASRLFHYPLAFSLQLMCSKLTSKYIRSDSKDYETIGMIG